MPSKEWYSKPENRERQRINRKKWYEKNKETERAKAIVRSKISRDEISKKYNEYKLGLKCCECGFSHPAALEFHHTDPTKKDFNPSEKNKFITWERFLKEVEKCIVLCANCHRIHHYNERNKI